MEEIGAFLVLFGLAFLAFAGFVVYFIFKQLEFVIRAIGLYEKMVNRQDTIIKLLMQLRDGTSGDQDAHVPPIAAERLPATDQAPSNVKCPDCGYLNRVYEIPESGKLQCTDCGKLFAL